MPSMPHTLMTTRAGGLSLAPYDSLNLGDHVGDASGAVAANRKILEKQIGVRPVFLKQTHGMHCLRIDASTPDGVEADACVTTSPDVACTIMVADCLPVLFWNDSGSAVGAAHVGWRGFVGDILKATLDKLCRLSMPREPIHAWLGACIGFENFEVGAEVAMHFDENFKREIAGGKWLVNLAGAARQRLFDLGVATVGGNDEKPSWCTVLNERDYFSHRRDSKLSGVTGRMAASIWLSEERRLWQS
ncbi:MAG: peptidoglycan editing factor PgeF [Cytophagales bacterium]|nr:peptidoglycan editing factor PgeF [Cytophagales bacterium]